MQHARLSDDWSPPLTADSAAPSIHTDSLLLTPDRMEFYDEQTTLNYQYARLAHSSDPLQSKRGFERPSFTRIAIHTVLCLIAYPVFYILTLVGRDEQLFIVRLLVAMWCTGIGFALRYSLLEIGVQHIEAATWATLIHMSYEEGGIKLGVLARNSQNPTGLLSALWIFLCRFGSPEITGGPRRSSYDRRPWSVFIGFFIALATLGPMLPFLLGRIMNIETFVRNQHMVYHEVLIAGDLSQEDIDRAHAQLGAFQSFAQTWTLLPYGTSQPDYVEFPYANETVYFPQPSSSQFIPGGSGLGSFDVNQTASLKVNPNNAKPVALTNEYATGNTLRYPQWGIRIHCTKLPDPKVNLIPFSSQSFTYAFLPQELLRGLFASYGMDLPALLTKPDLTLLDPNDTIPSSIDPLKISYLIKWSGNGVAHNFHTRTILDTGATSDQGWTTVETVAIRLNTNFTPRGRFPVYSNAPGADGVEARIGYDAAVCVEKYEPWIVEAYTTSVGHPTILRLIEKGYGNTSLPSGKIQGDPIQETRYLNTTRKNPAFYVAHDNGINQMLKDNGRDFFYVPSPTTVSFTDGAGPDGYTELSSDRFAIIRARVEAANVLPYLAGSGPVVAQSYPDWTLAYVSYSSWQLIGLLLLVMILGLTGELFVPTLPLNIPRRDFGVYSWLALFQSQELQFEVTQDLNKMNLIELEEKLCDMEVKIV